jgi:2-phosphosulfolactate phosphatase
MFLIIKFHLQGLRSPKIRSLLIVNEVVFGQAKRSKWDIMDRNKLENILRMDIDVIFSASEVSESRVKGKTAVVIDVLRATSVMVTALSNGASKVVPVLSPGEAFSYRANCREKVILAGERNADPIEGFDFGNSPLDMLPAYIKEATLVMTTTNGTRAFRCAESASQLLIAAFLNAKSTTEALLHFDDIVLIGSGSNGVFTMEDTLCAGYLVHLIEHEGGCRLNLSDSAVASRQLFLNAQFNIHEIASQGRHYSLLKSKGLDDDLEYCFRMNELNIVCQRKEEAILAVPGIG